MLMKARGAAIALIALGGLALGTATPAHALFQIKLSETGYADLYVPFTPAPDGTPSLAFSGIYGDFFITVLGQSTNSPGASDASYVLGATTQVQNLKQGTGSDTLTITTSANNFTQPNTNPLHFFSGASGTFASPSGGSVAFQSYGDANNTLYTQSGTATYTTGPQSFTSPTIGTASTGEADGYFATGVPYSLSNVASITLKEGSTAGVVQNVLDGLGQVIADPTNPAGVLQKVTANTGGSLANYSDHTEVLPTPEPATVVTAVLGLGLFGGLGYARRRKAD